MSETNTEGSGAPTNPPTDPPNDPPADPPTDARAVEVAELKRQLEAANKRSSGRYTEMKRAQNQERRLGDKIKQMEFNDKDDVIKIAQQYRRYEMQIEELKGKLEEGTQEHIEHIRSEYKKHYESIIVRVDASCKTKLGEQRVQLEQKCAQVEQKFLAKQAEVDAALKAKQHTEQLLEAEKKEKQTLQETNNTLQQENKQLQEDNELKTKEIEFLKDKLQAQAAEQRTASPPKTKWQLGGQASSTPSKPDGSQRA